MNLYPFIEAEKAQQRNVKRACELLKVSRAAYYAARAGQPSDRDRQDAGLSVLITAEHKRSRGCYGVPRIHAELRRQGHRHSRKRVARLMRRAGLAGRAPRRWKKTTIPDPAAAARADQVRRDFTADAMPDFSADSPTPVYVRVADWIESRIKSGELKSDARLPTERDLARDFGVAYDTVRRAAVLLRERGLIITVHGRGTYVA